MNFLLLSRFLREKVVLFKKVNKLLIVDCLRLMLDPVKADLSSCKMILPSVEVKESLKINSLLLFVSLCSGLFRTQRAIISLQLIVDFRLFSICRKVENFISNSTDFINYFLSLFLVILNIR